MTTALTIGNFDGVHLGHAALLRAARSGDAPARRVVALAFDPHPLSVLRPGHAPPPLTTFESRAQRLLELGASEVVRLEPSHDLLDAPPERFVDDLVARFRPGVFVEGEDFHFGRERRGNVRLLAELGRSRGFEVRVVEPVLVALGDQHVARASSSLARWLLSHARADDARRVLGRPYELAGPVIPGDRRGRTIGFPTLNVRPGTMLPRTGVYAGVACLPDSSRFLAAVNVGTRPTFAGTEVRVEAHLVDAPATGEGRLPGLEEYGWPVTLQLTGFVRDELRFPSLEALQAQLGRDVARVRQMQAPIEGLVRA